MGEQRMVIGDDIVPSKERSVIEQPLPPAVVAPVVDKANPAG
jgi:hypothetical protein